MDKTRMAVAVFDKLAAVYQQKYGDVSRYQHTLNAFCAAITRPNARILELACGPGNITRYLLNQRPDFQIHATDLAPAMLQLARELNPEAVVALMDCRQLSSSTVSYDGIMCGFGLPYLSRAEAVQLIAAASQQLNKGGIIYLSTMEDDYNRSGYSRSSSGDRIYLYYHQADYLQQALSQSGFRIVVMEREQYPGPDGSAVTDLIIIARLEEQVSDQQASPSP